jgi:hypothetical protein
MEKIVEMGEDIKNGEKMKSRGEKMHITFGGNLGRHLMTPRGLKSKMVEKFVGV